jgi:hypothetical protein
VERASVQGSNQEAGRRRPWLRIASIAVTRFACMLRLTLKMSWPVRRRGEINGSRRVGVSLDLRSFGHGLRYVLCCYLVGIFRVPSLFGTIVFAKLGMYTPAASISAGAASAVQHSGSGRVFY